MPVPDEFVIAPDFQLCEICEKDYPDNEFVYVVVDNDKVGTEHKKRIYSMCKYCREKCRTDSEYKKFVTEKVFNMKLGRRINCWKENKLSDNILEVPVPHIVQEVICIRCKKRFIDVRPKKLWLKDCQCPKCKRTGFLIATGQEIDEEDLEG